MIIQIGDRKIGKGNPVFIIAEIGLNHNGSVKTAKKLIDIAKEAGADAVKFQKRDLDSIYQQSVLRDPNKSEQAFQYLIPLLKKFELGEEEYKEIIDYCKEKDIIFLCTPWDIPSVNFLEKLNVLGYKIGSPDLTNLPLLAYVALKKKPILISSGMSTLEEIDKSINFLKKKEAEFLLFHCSSTYPAPLESIHLNFIRALEKRYQVPIGYSGHERGIGVSIAAVGMGAVAIERHITLDRKMEGPDHRASLEPEEFKDMVLGIREAEKALGEAKKIMTRGEVLTREVLGKSLVATRDIKAGEIFKTSMIAVKGPGKGLSPQRIFDLIGKTAERNIKNDELFLESDLLKEKLFLSQKDYQFKRIWGLKTRLSELDETAKFDPRLLELHFSDKDLEVPFNKKHYDQYLYIHAPEYWHHQLIDLCSFNEKERKMSISVMEKTLKRARELSPYFKGEPKVILHIGGMNLRKVSNRKKILENGIDSFKKLNTKGVEILPENLPPRPWYFSGQWYQNFFTRAEDMIEFCRALGLSMTLDVSHAKLYCNLEKRDFLEYTKKIAPLVKHIHFADAKGIDGEGLQIEEGEIDFEATIEVLKDYEWSWVPEIWRGHQQNYKGFMLALDKLSKYKDL